MNYERQKLFFEVGDVVLPQERRNAGFYEKNYQVLSMKAHYRVESIRSARGGHQLLTLKAVSEDTPKHLDGGAFSGYDARNFKLISKGDGTVNVTGNAKKTANWIIVDASTGSIVGSIPLTDVPVSEAVGEKPNLFVADPVRGTADFLNRFGDSKSVSMTDRATYTEKLVDDKIAELLRKNPEGSYLAFKHIKTGQLPVMPVLWTTA